MLEKMEEELNDLEVDWLIDDYGFCLEVKRRETENGEGEHGFFACGDGRGP
jgi:hypothetical protein